MVPNLSRIKDTVPVRYFAFLEEVVDGGAGRAIVCLLWVLESLDVPALFGMRSETELRDDFLSWAHGGGT